MGEGKRKTSNLGITIRQSNPTAQHTGEGPHSSKRDRTIEEAGLMDKSFSTPDIPNDFAANDWICDRDDCSYQIRKRNGKMALLDGSDFYGWINIESAMIFNGQLVPHWRRA